MSDPSPQSIHGPGGLLATPGLAAPKKRKWGQRLKAKQIVGNLYRSDTGQFQAGGASSAAPARGRQLSAAPTVRTPKPAATPKRRASGGKGRAAAKPKQTPEQRQAERDTARQAKQTANRDAVKQAMADSDQGLAPGGFDALMGLSAGTEPADKGDGLIAMGVAERGGDGVLRLTESGRAAVSAANRGDAKAAIDAVSRGSDQAKKRADAAAKKPPTETKPETPKGGGGGGSKAPDKVQERQRTADATGPKVGLAKADVAALRQASEAGGVQSPALSALGFIGPDGLTTDQGRRALSALERGDVRQYQAALQDAKARQGREAAGADHKQQAELRRQTRANERQATQQRALGRLKRRAQAGGKLTQTQRDQLTDAGMADESNSMWRVKAKPTISDYPDQSQFAGYTMEDWDHDRPVQKPSRVAVEAARTQLAQALGVDTVAQPPSFAVFKDHAGQHRWVARTTTAYQDRDDEIISEAALDQDSQRMTATKQFGPLRYWHVGEPDPLRQDAPWGPGLDIGDCDYSVLIGRTRIESGTFRSPAIAEAIAQKAEQYELSPGFFHPLDQPHDGVFSAIRTFERSIVPTRYGRASNLFTGLAVKEHRMDAQEMERRFKVAITDLGLDPAAAAALGQQLVATEKAATAQRIAFKSEAAPAALEEITINGVVYTVKAAPPMPPLEDLDAPVEAKADDPLGDMAEEVEEEEPAGAFVGDLTPDDFFARLDEHLAPLIKMQEMVKALNDGVGELKSMQGGTATKEAGVSAELTALKTAQAELAQQIAAIEGRQPDVILPDEALAALKSAGPVQTPPPDRPEITDVVNDPNRPWAGWAKQTYPKLYQVPE